MRGGDLRVHACTTPEQPLGVILSGEALGGGSCPSLSLSFKGGWCVPCQRKATAAAKSFQSCSALCDPIDSSSPGSSVPGILQARILELPFPSPMHACMLSHFSRVQFGATPWIAAHQAPLSTGFSRQEYWNGLPFPSPKESRLTV